MNVLKKIEKCFKKFSSENFILATDADREGELIGRLILRHVGFRHYETARRFWVSEALTPDVVRKGIAAAEPLSNYDGLEEQGQARQHADWLIGMNCTRLLTCSAGKFLTFGRVQTAVLNAVCLRDRQVENFKPEPYVQVRASCNKDGSGFDMLLLGKDGESCRFAPDDGFLEECRMAVLPASTLKVVSVESERKTENPPALFNLTELQRKCSTAFGLKPKDTLSIVQSLYEDLKCMSYPRTASRYLGDDNVELFREKFNLLSKVYAKEASGCCPDFISGDNHAVFNSKKVEGHHALIPLAPLPDSASDVQRKVYGAVLDRFFAVVKKPYVYNSIHVTAEKDSFTFRASGRTVIQHGWHGGSADAEDDSADSADGEECGELPHLAEGDSLQVVGLKFENKETKPPKRFTNSALLALMQNPRGNDGEGKLVGLGTEATRASIIDELIQRGYIEQKGKSLVSTDVGRFLISSVEGISSLAKLVSIETTTRWEGLLASNPGKFLEGIRLFVTQEVPKLAVAKKWVAPEKESLGVCPVCGKGKVYEGKKSFFCSCFKDGCKFVIWKDICGASVSASDAKLLVQGKETRVKKMKSKAGKAFSAKLKFKDGKVSFVFEDNRTKDRKGSGGDSTVKKKPAGK